MCYFIVEMVKKAIFLIGIVFALGSHAGAQVFKNATATSSSFSEKADYGVVSYTRKNFQKGYDYYGPNNTYLGHSERNSYGGYDYYDASGNFLGRIKKNKEGKYLIFNYEDVKVGELRRLPSKKYLHTQQYRGGFSELESIPTENLGSINPYELFRDH